MGWIAKRPCKVSRNGKLEIVAPGRPLPEAEGYKNPSAWAIWSDNAVQDAVSTDEGEFSSLDIRKLRKLAQQAQDISKDDSTDVKKASREELILIIKSVDMNKKPVKNVKPEGNKSEGNKSEGNKSEGNKSEGNKSEGNKSEDVKPEDVKPEDVKPEGDKVNYSELGIKKLRKVLKDLLKGSDTDLVIKKLSKEELISEIEKNSSKEG